MPSGAGLQRAMLRRQLCDEKVGHSLNSARALNSQILRTLHEDQIFRIDHFLGKDTVQNIMAFRFANGIFEPMWNRDRIDHVQITAAETVGVEGRGSFYEATGALRDMVPNHLFTLLSMVTMEDPAPQMLQEGVGGPVIVGRSENPNVLRSDGCARPHATF